LDDRTLSDKNLFLRIAQDDERAFNELFHVYTRELYPFAMKLTGSETDAEEILQEVFLKIWAKRKELTGIDTAIKKPAPPFRHFRQRTRGLAG